MILLAIDPGLANVGWAVFENGVLYRVGTIHTDRGPRFGRLDTLAGEFRLNKLENPDMVAFEMPLGFGNANTMGDVWGCVGVIAGMFYGTDMRAVKAMDIKKWADAPKGRKESKAAVKRRVEQRLGTLLLGDVDDHAVDAIAVGLVCLGL
jgi:Holliday junction resolvasome RuvABC endonuclease subunit